MNDQDFGKMITNYFQNDYRERGKVKWNGYFLSDHTSSLKNETRERHKATKKLPRMTVNDMKQLLQHAVLNYEYVTVQQDISDATGTMVYNTIGEVSGFSELGVVINGEHILFENLRAVVMKNDIL